MRAHRNALMGLTLGLALGLSGKPAAAAERLADVGLQGGALSVRPLVEAEGLSVTVTGPQGFALTRSFARSEAALLDLREAAGAPLADGVYKYEVTLGARPEASPAALQAAREAQDSGAAARTRRPSLVESGSFRIAGGVLEAASGEEPQAALAARAAGPLGPQATDDFVINDDLIVQGSTCVGFDCVSGESFGFDTIRLKENNTRITFDDTSASGFPANNWQIRANGSSGDNFLGFVDLGATATGENGTVVFGVEAGAGANALWVDQSGRMGLGTSAPLLDIHLKASNTPSLRMEQDNSGGFTAQTWDIAGNEASFFVRDVTGGSRLPFRIRPGAPTNSVDIGATGNVGIGTASANAPLHVRRSDGTAKLLVEETSTSADRVLMHLQNSAPNSKARFLIQSGTSTSGIWSFDNNGQSADSFSITRVAAGVNAFTLTATGNLTIAGSLTQNSDRHTKDGIEPVDAHDVLKRVGALPISTWHLKTDAPGVKHLGPMAQDFAAAFGLGADERQLAPVDVGGVALAAIQALNEVVAAKDARLSALEQQNAELGARLTALEAAAGK